MLGSGGFYAYNDAAVHRAQHLEPHAGSTTTKAAANAAPAAKAPAGWRSAVPLEHGEGRTEDIDLLWDIQRKIEGNTICPLGDAAAGPWLRPSAHFRDEFEYHAGCHRTTHDPKESEGPEALRP
jgi:NADH-quinone oxidoreductase subunit F